jgi:hypothetical protein
MGCLSGGVGVSEVTVGQAAKTAGVPTEVLRELCEARRVRARKGERGHWYLDPADIPTRDWVFEAVRQKYRDDIAGAQEAMGRFMREVEAVQLDLNEAAQDTTGEGRLGNDLLAFGTGPFERASQTLWLRLMQLERSHRHLQAAVDTPAPDSEQGS